MDWLLLLGGLFFAAGMYGCGREHEQKKWEAMIQELRDKHPEIDWDQAELNDVNLRDIDIEEGDVLVARKACGCITSAYLGDTADEAEVTEWYKSLNTVVTITSEPGPVGVTILGGCPHA